MSFPAADRPQSATINSKSSYKLSPIQQGMLFDNLSGKQPGTDIEQVVCTLGENLNVAALLASWQEIVQQHPILRTSVSWVDRDVPLQIANQQVELPIIEEDWRNLLPDDRTNKLQDFLQADRLQGFALDRPPLMRLALFHKAETEYQLIWTYHHILLDSTSAITILQEVFTWYESLAKDGELGLKTIDFAKDCFDRTLQPDIAAAETFWKQYLNGFTDPTPLVSGVSPAAKNQNLQENLPAASEINLSRAVTAALNTLIQEKELSLNTLLQGVWALLLSRYADVQDVVFGVVCDGRSHLQNTESTAIGLFINTLPLRAIVPPEMRAIEWLQQLQKQWEALQQYSNVPLVKTQEWSEIPRSICLSVSTEIAARGHHRRRTVANQSLHCHFFPTARKLHLAQSIRSFRESRSNSLYTQR